jgi:hypothetical protein
LSGDKRKYIFENLVPNMTLFMMLCGRVFATIAILEKQPSVVDNYRTNYSRALAPNTTPLLTASKSKQGGKTAKTKAKASSQKKKIKS